MGQRIKYMSISHTHQLEAGDNFGGRLATPLSSTVTFDRSNNWVVDVEEVGLSPEAVEVILSDPDFLDVTGMELIPLNRHQTTFLGMQGVYEPVPEVDPDAEQVAQAQAEAEAAAAAEQAEREAAEKAAAAESAKTEKQRNR